MSKINKLLLSIIAVEIIIISILLKFQSVNSAEKEHTTPAETTTTTIESTTETSGGIIASVIPEPTLEEIYKSVFDWQVYGGDFGIEQLYFLKDQCDKYDIPMEIMLSLICTESSFRSDAKAKTTSASGYCQIIKSTAEWIYEDKLRYGEYDVNNHVTIMTTNWKLNIEISCRLMHCLYHSNGKSWETAVKYYFSKTDSGNITYLNTVNAHMNELFDMSVSDFT
jgi:hypothetical protein